MIALLLAFCAWTACARGGPKEVVRTPIKGWKKVTFPNMGVEVDLPVIKSRLRNQIYSNSSPYPRKAKEINIIIHPSHGAIFGFVEPRYRFGMSLVRRPHDWWEGQKRSRIRWRNYPDDFTTADDVFMTRTQEGYLKRPSLKTGQHWNIYFVERGFRTATGDVISVEGSFDVIPGFNDQYFDEDREMILRIINSIKLIE